MKKDKKIKKEEKEKAKKEAEEEIDKMINELENQLGINKEQVKIVKINIPKRNLKNILIEALFTILINMILILSLSGYIIWAKYNSIFDLVYFTLILSSIEILFNNLIYLFFKKYITLSFGFILYVPILLAIVISLLVYKNIKTTSTGSIMFMFVCVLLLRSFIKRLVFSYKNRRILKR